MGLSHLHGVMATREQYRDRIDLQLVAFPQQGVAVRPGTLELLEQAVRIDIAYGGSCTAGKREGRLMIRRNSPVRPGPSFSRWSFDRRRSLSWRVTLLFSINS